MHFSKTLLASAFILGLGLGAANVALAAETAGHAGHQATEFVLTLNNGAKWQGDDNMIRGMDAIRSTLAPHVAAVHGGSLSAEQYQALASGITDQVDFMVTNCKLTPETDEQFHMVLGQVLDGVHEMETGPDRAAGAVRIASALNAYGDYFVHPGWQPLD
jgi:hypothetical protein